MAIIILCLISGATLGGLMLLRSQLRSWFEKIAIRLEERNNFHTGLRESLTQLLLEQGHQLNQNHLASLKIITDSLHSSIGGMRTQLVESLLTHTQGLTQKIETMITATDQRLQEINWQVERRLSEGFEKTTATFTDVVKRLALIDEAQKKITALSENVVSLQDILSDKRARGAFGEVQLASLVKNLLPPDGFALQHTLSNGKRVDCLLFLPQPTGNIGIDAKFPLESYQRYVNPQLSETERREARQQFRLDIRKHLQDIAEKYIIPGETSDGAMMFLPAEAIFAELHSSYPDLIDLSHRLKVWLASPTTLMAILTTARAVIKDLATRQQIGVIQQHLVLLSKDFERFQVRMDSLSKHISQVSADAEDVNRSAKKISSRFKTIEQVEVKESVDLVSKIYPAQNASEAEVFES